MLKLSLREREVYALIVLENLSAEQIAEKLCVSISTAKKHINNILYKRNEKCCRDMIFKYYKELLNDYEIDSTVEKAFREEIINSNENTGYCTKVVRFD